MGIEAPTLAELHSLYVRARVHRQAGVAFAMHLAILEMLEHRMGPGLRLEPRLMDEAWNQVRMVPARGIAHPATLDDVNGLTVRSRIHGLEAVGHRLAHAVDLLVAEELAAISADLPARSQPGAIGPGEGVAGM